MWVNKYGGNLIFWVDNSSGDNLKIEICIDGKSVELDAMENDFFFNYSSILHEPLGKKIISVNVNNGEIFIEKEILLLSIRWLRVWVGNKHDSANEEKDELIIIINSSLSPPMMN